MKQDLITSSVNLMYFEYFKDDARIAENDHDERESVHDHESEDGVNQFMALRWKGIESDALLVPLELRMPLYMEYQRLQKQ